MLSLRLAQSHWTTINNKTSSHHKIYIKKKSSSDAEERVMPFAKISNDRRRCIFSLYKQVIRLCCWATAVVRERETAFLFAFPRFCNLAFLALGCKPALLFGFFLRDLLHSFILLIAPAQHSMFSTNTSHLWFYFGNRPGCYLTCIAITSSVFRIVILHSGWD